MTSAAWNDRTDSSPGVRPVAVSSGRRLAPVVYDLLKDRLLEGEYQAGERLSVEALKAEFDAVNAAKSSLDLVQRQYDSGAANYVSLLAQQQIYQQARLAVVQAQAARFADTAALFQALGGGWWNRIDVAPNPYSPEANGLAEHVDALVNAPAATELHQ